MIAILNDYKWQNEPSELEETESFLPGFNFALALTAILSSTIAFSSLTQTRD